MLYKLKLRPGKVEVSEGDVTSMIVRATSPHDARVFAMRRTGEPYWFMPSIADCRRVPSDGKRAVFAQERANWTGRI